MKKIIHFILAILFIAISIGCTKSKKTEELATVKEPPVIEKSDYTVVGRVIDAKTKDPIGDVEVNVISQDSEANIDYNEMTVNDDGVTKGYITIVADKTGIQLNVQVSKIGYIDTGKQILATTEDKNQFTIEMVKVGEEPEGVKVVVQEEEVKDDGTSEVAITVESTVDVKDTDTNKNIEEKVTVTIPAGTQMTTKDDKPVSGKISMVVAQYSATNKENIDIIPGGTAVVADIDESTKDENIALSTIGFTSIKIEDENGNEVKNFNEPIEIFMELNKNTYNPETNEDVKVGDIIKIFSYDEQNGKWTYENDGTIENIGKDDVYGVKISVTHLTSFSMSFFLLDEQLCTEFNLNSENYGKILHHSPTPAKSVISLHSSSEIPLSSLN